MFWRIIKLFCVLWLFTETSAQPCGLEFDLRLTQTSSLTVGNSGRLEVCRNGRWGSIGTASTSFWSSKNVLVACEYLDYPSGLNSVPAIQLSVVDQASTDLPVHMEGVVCNGTEKSLGDCQFNDLAGIALHNSDVYIVCLPGPQNNYSGLYNLRPGEMPQREGDVRLKGSVANGRGAVEIYTRLGWSSICPDSSWTSTDAAVICQNLGYESGVAEDFPLNPALIEPRRVYDAECGAQASGESTLFRIVAGDCSFSDSVTEISSLCPFPSNIFAGVSCRTGNALVSTRLLPQTTEDDTLQGIVEVLIDSRWGLVCQPSDLVETAPSICQGLGHMRDSSMIIDSNTNNLLMRVSRVKPIWYPDLTCTGDSQSLSDCTPGSPVGYGNCASVLAVQCQIIPYSLPGGGVAGIVIAVLVVVGFTLWFFLHFKPNVWDKRHGSKWFRNMTSCWDSFTSCGCCARAPAPITVRPASVVPSPPPPAADPQVQRRSSGAEPDPDPDPEPEDRELTAAAPPTYRAAAEFPNPTEELPPPYPGPSSYPPLGATGSCPPPTQAKFPYPPAGVPAYPPPTTGGVYPPPVGYPPTGNPAYPPPTGGAYPT